MSFSSIQQNLLENFPQVEFHFEANAPQPFFVVPREFMRSVAAHLHAHPALYFDYLACLSAVDWGAKKDQMELIYHLQSITRGLFITMKVIIPREGAAYPKRLPFAYTVSDVWRAAEWHEREIYDLFGIEFRKHPNLKRILLPEDWKGHPLRKDYQQAPEYHGILCLTENVEKGGKKY